MNSRQIPQLVTGLGLFILLLTSCGGPLGGTSSPPEPKVGQWQGDYLSFVVTEDGTLQNLSVEGERAFDKNCEFKKVVGRPHGKPPRGEISYVFTPN